MKFRSIVMDYKAEALQILREEKKCDKKRRRRTIRVVSESGKEPLNLSEGKTSLRTPVVTRSSLESSDLPSWLTESPLKQNHKITDETSAATNAVVTTISSSRSTEKEKISRTTSSVIDGEEENLVGSNNYCIMVGRTRQIPKEKSPAVKRKACDFKIFFVAPWLIDLVSTIRQRANRKRIANKACRTNLRRLCVSYRDCRPNDSFSRRRRRLHCKILRSAIDRCWFQNTFRSGWNRLEALSRIAFDTRIPDSSSNRNQDVIGEMHSDGIFSVSAFLHDRNGGFGKVFQPRVRKSNALATYRNPSAAASFPNTAITGGTLPEHSPSMSLKLWETAILTAAALCTFQQQQQQQRQRQRQKLKEKKVTKAKALQGNLRENGVFGRNENREVTAKKPPYHENDKNDEYKNEPRVSGQNQGCIHDSGHHRRSSGLRQHRSLRSRSVEKVIFSEVCRPRTENAVLRNRRKRSPSPSRQEENKDFLPKQKRSQREGRPKDQPIHDIKEVKTGPLRSNRHLNSSSKTNRLETYRRNELFLLQRFGLLPTSKKNVSENGRSIDLATSSESDSLDSQIIERRGSEDSKDGIANSRRDRDQCHPGVSNSEEDGYSSPIEFPVSFDDYEEEDEEEEDINHERKAGIETKEEPIDLPTLNDARPTPRSLQQKIESYDQESGDQQFLSGESISQRNQKTESCSFSDSSTEYSANQPWKKKGGKSKKRKRTRGEAELRKNGKRYRKKSKERKKDRKVEVEEQPAGFSNEDRSEKEGDKLETPKKLNFKDFSPVKTSTKETKTKNLPVLNQSNYLGSTAVKRMPVEKSESRKNEFSNSPFPTSRGNSSLLEKGFGPNNSFSNSPDEILQTSTCNGGVGRVQIKQDEKPLVATLDLDVSDNPFTVYPEDIFQTISSPDPVMRPLEEKPDAGASIDILCSETFFENFGETVSEITRSGSVVSGTHKTSIRFIDTHLVDICSVDIEMPSRGAMVVSTISHIQKSGGIMTFFLPRIVELATTNRYNRLVVFLCVDMALDSTVARDIVRLQSAFLSCERGSPRTQTTVQVCSKRTLGASMTRNIFRCVQSENKILSKFVSNIDDWLSDARTCQRLKFLISVIPTLSVMGALCWVSTWSPLRNPNQLSNNKEEDITSEWFQQCFSNVRAERRRLESHMLNSKSDLSQSNSKLTDFLNPFVPIQLVLAVDAHLKKG